MKRIVDLVGSLLGLLLSAPVVVPVMLLVWTQDGHSPFYIAPRVGRGGRLFRMVKLRSMKVGADKSGVDSTSAGDSRITPVGGFIRRYKLDEIMQLVNVLMGEMSLVGPRPNVPRETDLYTADERRLLSVRPGITDFASIVFSDEGDILAGRPDPDLAYNQLIRPWKSRLGLIYIGHRNLALDLKLLWWTLVSLVSRPAALRSVAAALEHLGAEEPTLTVARRERALVPHPPPGMDTVVRSRQGA